MNEIKWNNVLIKFGFPKYRHERTVNKGSVEKIEAHNKRSEDRKWEEQKKSIA